MAVARSKPNLSKRAPSRTAGISDEAVLRATGKTWEEWGRVLDRAGAKEMSHKAIAEHVGEVHGVGSWWRQMVTVGYEQSRGLRAPHETARGYQVGRSKTLAVPLRTLYRAWKDASQRARWMSGEVIVRKATSNRSLRMTWCADETNLDVMFYETSSGKAQVTVQHEKLPDARSAERMKKFWGAQLEGLAEHLGVGVTTAVTRTTKRARTATRERARR